MKVHNLSGHTCGTGTMFEVTDNLLTAHESSPDTIRE